MNSKQLSALDLEYYSKVDHWGGGPTFDGIFIFQPFVSSTDVIEKTSCYLDLLPWEIDLPPRHCILFLPESESSVGVSIMFTSSDMVGEPTSEFDLFIRPCQFERLTGKHPEGDLEGCRKPPLHELVRLLVSTGNRLKSDFSELKFLTLDHEDNVYISPRVSGAPEGIYISQSIADALQLDAKPIFQDRHWNLSFIPWGFQID